MSHATADHPVAVLRLLRAVVAGLSNSARAIESTTGITNAQLFLLRQVGAARKISVSELADRIAARQNTVSAVLGRLTATGLVRKSASSRDGRRAELSLTPAGRRLLRRAPASPTDQLLGTLAALPAPERRALARGLGSLVTALRLDAGGAPLLFEPVRHRRPPRELP